MPITTLHEYVEVVDGNVGFASQYKDDVFLLWYSAGKPLIPRLRALITEELGVDPKNNRIPDTTTVKRRIDEEFRARAVALDQEVDHQLQEQVVQQKVEMLQRHAQIARTMQETALAYLEEHGLGSSRNALVALTEGLKIERESVGIIPFFEKISDLSDDALMSELKRLVSKSPVTFENASRASDVEEIT